MPVLLVGTKFDLRDKEKVIKKRTSVEVQQNPIKKKDQSFQFGNQGWFTKDGCQVKGGDEEKSAEYYKRQLEELQKKYDDTQKVSIPKVIT